jgi:lysyl-tRNA synthetase class 1
LGNPAYHIHRGQLPENGPPVSFGLLLNLAGVLGADATAERMWAYLGNYVPGVTPASAPQLDALITHALAYNRDFVAPNLVRRAPAANEAAALQALDSALAGLGADASADDIQNAVYEIGKQEEYGFAGLRDWFRALYQILLGSEQGPRMGSFIALYGIDNSRALIADALSQG